MLRLGADLVSEPQKFTPLRTFIYGLAVSFIAFFRNWAQPLTETSFSLQQLTFLIHKITKQDKETIDKRAKEAPESDKTVCCETEVVLGYEA